MSCMQCVQTKMYVRTPPLTCMPGKNAISIIPQHGHLKACSPMHATHDAWSALSRMACLTFAIRKSDPESHSTKPVRRGQVIMPVRPSTACSQMHESSGRSRGMT